MSRWIISKCESKKIHMDIYSMNNREATTLHLKLIFRLTKLLIEPYLETSTVFVLPPIS